MSGFSQSKHCKQESQQFPILRNALLPLFTTSLRIMALLTPNVNTQLCFHSFVYRTVLEIWHTICISLLLLLDIWTVFNCGLWVFLCEPVGGCIFAGHTSRHGLAGPGYVCIRLRWTPMNCLQNGSFNLDVPGVNKDLVSSNVGCLLTTVFLLQPVAGLLYCNVVTLIFITWWLMKGTTFHCPLVIGGGVILSC